VVKGGDKVGKKEGGGPFFYRLIKFEMIS